MHEDNLQSFVEAKNYMMTSQIQCFKYNNSLDKAVQKFNCYDAFISLSSDGNELIITNRKPNANMEKDIKEKSKKQLSQMKERSIQGQRKRPTKANHSGSSIELEGENIFNELD